MKNAVIGLSVALACALIVIAYLLGQRSMFAAQSSVRAVNEERVRPGIPEELHRAEYPQRMLPAAEPVAAPAAETPSEPVVERKGGAINIVTPGNAISRYLDQVHALQVGPASNDQNAFAQQLLGESMKGDLSTFDDLARQAKDAEKRARAITPPPGAEAHHAKLLDLLRKARASWPANARRSQARIQRRWARC